MSATRSLRLLALALLLTLTMLSCDKKPMSSVAPEPAAPAPAAQVERSVLLTYYSGSVEKSSGGDWEVIDIGARLASGESVRTGADSFCELQVGDVAVVRLQADTLLAIQDVVATTAKTEASVGLSAGSVLCRVERLSGSDRFRVKTGSAICGVRGTEFAVSVSAQGDTLVSVKKGRVSVLPASADVDAVKKTIEEAVEAAPAAGDGAEEQKRTVELLEERVEALEQAAPVVEENQELVVTAAASEELTRAVANIQAKAAELAKAAAAPGESEISGFRQLVDSATRVVAGVVDEPVEISVESVRTLAATEQMRLVEVPGAAAAGTEPAPALRAIAVTVTPADASILRDGTVLARGSYHGLFREGEVLDFSFVRDGYEGTTLRVTVDKSKDSYRVTLEEDLRPVSLRAIPSDATVNLDGKKVGTGSYSGTFRPGERLSFSVEREGYKSVTMQVEVAKTGAADYAVELEKLPVGAAALEELRIQAEPFGAEILVNGKLAGSGSYSTSVEAGSLLAVTVRKEGYKPQTLSLTVPKGGLTQSVTLEEEKETITIQASPQDAEIVLDGQIVGTGRFSREYSRGGSLTFLVRKKDYRTEVLEIRVEKGSGRTYAVQLREEKEQIGFVARPDDAEIVVNGEVRGRGSHAAEYSRGQKLSVLVRRSGYYQKNLEVDVAAGSSRTYTVELEQMVESISIEAVPADAEIVLDGTIVGTGKYTGTFPVGRKLAVEVRRQGYRGSSFTIDVVAGGGKSYPVTLERLMESIAIVTSPRDAEITIDGVSRGKGSAAGSYPVGSTVSVSVRRDGYSPQSFQIEVTEGGGGRREVTLQQRSGNVTLEVDVPDARILRDGKLVGTGSYSTSAAVGEAVELHVERTGYASQDVRLDPSDSAPLYRRITMDPRPVLWRRAVGSGGYTWSASLERGTVYVADKVGTLHAVVVGGPVLWSVETANKPNENSIPVLAGGIVYLAGSKELVAADASSGAVRSRVELAPSESAIFGRHVGLAGTSLVLPADDGLRLLDPATLKPLKTITVRGGSQMSAASRGAELYIASQQGVFFCLDAQSGAAKWELATEAVQPIAIAPVLAGRRAVFAGRKGDLACVDLDSHTLIWQGKLEAGKSIGVFQDLTVSGETLLVFAKSAIYVLSTASGKQLYEPLRDASSPALLAGGLLYYGKTDGSLAVADASTGRQRATLPLDAKVVTQPVLSGDSILVGTDKGELLQILPEVVLRQAGR